MLPFDLIVSKKKHVCHLLYANKQCISPSAPTLTPISLIALVAPQSLTFAEVAAAVVGVTCCRQSWNWPGQLAHLLYCHRGIGRVSGPREMISRPPSSSSSSSSWVPCNTCVAIFAFIALVPFVYYVIFHMAKNASMCVRLRVNRTEIFMLIFINFIVAPERSF